MLGGLGEMGVVCKRINGRFHEDIYRDASKGDVGRTKDLGGGERHVAARRCHARPNHPRESRELFSPSC